jgi:hypothetical protein
MSPSRQTKPLLIKDQQLLEKLFLVRKIQRSPRPGLKQKASQNSGEAKLSSEFTRVILLARSNCDTHGK